MKICVAQTRPVKGNIQSNIDNHCQFIDLAVSNGAEAIFFPELSLTGYEPTLSKELATDKDDSRLDTFQKISDTARVIIGAGIPTKNSDGICISMVIFHPYKARQLYSKHFLHADEEPYFISGQNNVGLPGNGSGIALAICYELSVPAHAENAFKCGAKIYIASVAKSVTGIDKALSRLSNIANQYSMTVLMSNCIGHSDGFECAGKTSVWNSKGLMMAQLNERNEGILILDTDTQEVIEKTI